MDMMLMEIRYQFIISRVNQEKFLLVLIIGILESVKRDGISIDESEKILFLPGYVNELRKMKINEEIVELVNFCCELEDIADIVPDKLESEINRFIETAINLLKEYQEEKKGCWILTDSFKLEH